MARPSPRQFRLRVEPYDANARDADNDGIVQEGTAWERPAGTRIVDLFNNEIRNGLTATQRSSQFRVVSRDGAPVKYIPTYDRGIDPMRSRQATSTSSALGVPNLQELGLRPIGQGRTIGDRHKNFVQTRRAAIGRLSDETLTLRHRQAAEERVKGVLSRRPLTEEERKIGHSVVVNAAFWGTTVLPVSGDISQMLNDALTGIVDSDTVDALNELREIYSAAGIAGLTLAFIATKERFNASKEQINQWVDQAQEWLQRQGVKAREISDRLKAAMREALDDLMRYFRPDGQPGGRMVPIFSVADFLTPDDLTPPKPPLAPELAQRLDRNISLLARLDAIETPVLPANRMNQTLDSIVKTPRDMTQSIDATFDMADALLRHKYVAPEPGFENINVDAKLAKIDDILQTQFRLPSIQKWGDGPNDSFAANPERGLQRLQLQREATKNLVKTISDADQLISINIDSIPNDQLLERLSDITKLPTTGLLDTFDQFYGGRTENPVDINDTRAALADFVYMYNLTKRDLANEKATQIAQQIKNRLPQSQITVDTTPGRMQELAPAVPVRQIDPRLGVTGTREEFSLMPTPHLLQIDDAQIKTIDAATEHLKKGGSLSDIPNSLWREALYGASSEGEIDKSTPFRRVIPDEGAVGEVSIFLLRDKNGESTTEGWVIKGSIERETINEVLGWNFAAAHGISRDGASFDGDTEELAHGINVNSPGLYAITPYTWGQFDTNPPNSLELPESRMSSYSPALLYNTEYQGLPEMFGAFLHSYLIGLEDRHSGNIMTAKINGQAVVIPIDFADTGSQINPKIDNKLTDYAYFAYSAHQTIFDDMKAMRRQLDADEQKRFDDRIERIYDSMMERALIISAMDENDFIDRFASGIPSGPKSEGRATQIRNQASEIFKSYKKAASDMKKFRTQTLSQIKD